MSEQRIPLQEQVRPGFHLFQAAPTRRQTLIWSVVPNGRSADHRLKFSLVVAPRLEILQGPKEAPLGIYFPDFADWPAWLRDTLWGQFRLEFEAINGGGKIPSRPASHPSGAQPDSQAWSAIFPDSTLVRSYVFAVENLTLDPVPPDNTALVDHLRGVYGYIGLESVINPPRTELLLQPQLFGALAAQAGGVQGAVQGLQGAALRQAASPLAGAQGAPGPAGGMKTMSGTLPPGFAPGSSEGGVRLLARNQVLVATKPVLPILTKTDVPSAYRAYLRKATATMQPGKNAGALQLGTHRYDFHEVVTILREYPDMLRLLGLVIDLEVDDPGVAGPVKVRIAHKNLGSQGNAKYDAMPWTACTLAADRFDAISQDGAMQQGMLRLQDASMFETVQLDVDGGALKALQFAGQLQQAKEQGKDNTAATNVLHALRSVGIGIRMHGRVQRQQDLFDKARALEAKLFLRDAKGEILGVNEDLTLYGENLVRGFRVDAGVYDEPAAAWQWYSLCRRTLEYHYGQNSRKNEEPTCEGTVTTGLSRSAGAAATDQYQLLETLFQWNGWSLVVPLPGQTDAAGSGGGEIPPDFPGDAPSDFQASGAAQGLYLQSRARVPRATLPRLRFGRKYRFRARTVDLAGNSLPPDLPEEATATAATLYRRFEPVGTPLLVPQQPLGPQSPGESLETMVIRSNFDAPMQKACVRHLAPPRTSSTMAEVHGKFDGPDGLDAQKGLALITAHSGTLPEFEAAASLTLNYLPDPLARGVAFGLLPGDAKPVENFFYGTPEAWPELKSLRLRLIEGTAPPQFSGSEITVSLAKAEVVRIPYASVFGGAEDLQLMALWGWVEEEYARQKQAGKVDGATLDKLYQTAKEMALIGAHWMLTPRREIVLVHAVKQPLREPVMVPVFDPAASRPEVMRRELHATWSMVDAVIETHGKSSGKIDLLAEWDEIVNDPDSDQGWRTVRVKNHVLDAPVHLDFLGYPASSGGLAYYLPHQGDDFGGLFLGAYLDRAVVEPARNQPAAVQQQNPDALAIAERFGLAQKWQGAGEGLAKIEAPRHDFGDTKHRKVDYTATATTRFREYFLPAREQQQRGLQRAAWFGKTKDVESGFTRSGPTVTVHVPNPARPGLLKPAYVVPTFGWEPLQTSAGERSRTRRGNGLRVYLEGPWFVSGEDEMLGVVIRPLPVAAGSPSPLARPTLITQWGQDPIWKSAPLPENLPTREQFAGYQDYAEGLSLGAQPEGSGEQVAVVGYPVAYDKDRGLWYADIALQPGNAYFPFVRLALARYQPYSVPDAHLSPVVLADFVQLAPDRQATITTVAGKGGKQLRVSVTGVSYGNDNQGPPAKTFSTMPPGKILPAATTPAAGAVVAAKGAESLRPDGSAAARQVAGKSTRGSLFEAGLERAQDGIDDPDLKWQPVAGSVVALTAGGFASQLLNLRYTWSGQVALPQEAGSYRLVIREYEEFAHESRQGTESVRRLVYAEAFEL